MFPCVYHACRLHIHAYLVLLQLKQQYAADINKQLSSKH
jgi:hypothetical protein